MVCLVFFFNIRYLMNVPVLFLIVINELQWIPLAYSVNVKFLLDPRWGWGLEFLNKTKGKFWLLAVSVKDATVCKIQANSVLSLDFKFFHLFTSNSKNSLSFIMPQNFLIKLSEAWWWWLKLQTALHPGHWAESLYQVVLLVAHCSYLVLLHSVIYFYERFPFSAISRSLSNYVIVNVCKY